MKLLTFVCILLSFNAVFRTTMAGLSPSARKNHQGTEDEINRIARAATIENFEELSDTTTSIKLGWTLSDPTKTVLKYTLVTDDLLSNDFLPPSPLEHEVIGLSPCSSYSFTLTATFEDGVGEVASLTAGTEYEVPGGVGDITISPENEMTWSVPAASNCVDQYNVCWFSDFTLASSCKLTTDLSLNLNDYLGLSGCEKGSFSVVAVNAEGGAGPKSTTLFESKYGDPSEPDNFLVTELTGFSVELTWNSPLENPACVARYNIEYGPQTQLTNGAMNHFEFFPSFRSESKDTIEDLSACLDYEFRVSAISITDTFSVAAIGYMETDTILPLEVTSIELVPGIDFINVDVGTAFKDSCLDHIQICHSDPVTAESKCDDITSSGGSVDGLTACQTYNFAVVGVNQKGENGPLSSLSSSTFEQAPGPVTDFSLVALSNDSIAVNYNGPVINPRCANEYVVIHTLAEDGRTRNDKQLQQTTDQPKKTDHEDVITDLEACAKYEVEVYALSVSGLIGSSKTKSMTTILKVPGVPRNPQVLAVTETSITVTWFASVDKYCVDSYYVTLGIEMNFPADHENGEQYLQTVEGLVACTDYEFSMFASNDAMGNSPNLAIGTVTTTCQ